LSNIKKALSKEERQPFYDVTAMTNELLDEEKKAIDKEIISLRPESANIVVIPSPAGFYKRTSTSSTNVPLIRFFL
jgi:hypothetical protein